MPLTSSEPREKPDAGREKAQKGGGGKKDSLVERETNRKSGRPAGDHVGFSVKETPKKKKKNTDQNALIR